MKRFLVIVGILVSVACAGRDRPVKTALFTQEVHFGFAKDDINSTETSNLFQSVAFLKNYPEKMVIIEGHTDSIGDKDFNLELGDRRAREVKHFLVTHGVASNQIIVVSYGEEVPMDDHKFAMNRRAVVRLTDSVEGGLQ